MSEAMDTEQQRTIVRSTALKHAVRWVDWPGARPSDVVAAAVWFEDYLLRGEDVVNPPDGVESSDRPDEPVYQAEVL